MFFNPNPLQAYDWMNTPNSGFSSPYAGMGLLNPITGGTMDTPWMTPPSGSNQQLPPTGVFNQTYAQGLQQLQGGSGYPPGMGPGTGGGGGTLPPPPPGHGAGGGAGHGIGTTAQNPLFNTLMQMLTQAGVA